jgi:hypothetical protein
MKSLPSPWQAYFGLHSVSVAVLEATGCQTVRGFGGPHVGLTRNYRNRAANAPAYVGPFTSEPVRVALTDIRRHGSPKGPSIDQLLQPIIENRLTAIYNCADLFHPSPAPFDKDLAYWTLRVIHERFPDAHKNVRWQWGNEVNSLHFDPTNIKAKIAKTGESKWKYANTVEKRQHYVEGFLAPAIETVYKVSRDVYGDPQRIPIVSGSIANIYNPKYRAWMDDVLNHRIEGAQAPSLADDPVFEHIDLLTVHYAFGRGNGAEVMQGIYDTWVKTDKVEALWITEEHGGQGKGPVTIVDRSMQFIDWAASNQLTADQTRLGWWGARINKPGGQGIEAVKILGQFLANSRLHVTRRRVGDATVYVLAGQGKKERIDRIIVAVVPDRSLTLAVGRLSLSLPESSRSAPWLARAVQFSAANRPVEWQPQLSTGRNPLIVNIDRVIEEPFVLFVKAPSSGTQAAGQP